MFNCPVQKGTVEDLIRGCVIHIEWVVVVDDSEITQSRPGGCVSLLILGLGFGLGFVVADFVFYEFDFVVATRRVCCGSDEHIYIYIYIYMFKRFV
jgi:hypothetical protein